MGGWSLDRWSRPASPAVLAVVLVGQRSRHPQEIPLANTYAQIQLQIEKLKG